MLYQIIYTEGDKRRLVTPLPVTLSFAKETLNRLNQYKVNPYGDYSIESVNVKCL